MPERVAIFDWFDIKNSEHREAYEFLQEHGRWPPSFIIPDWVDYPSGWTHSIAYRIIQALLVDRDRLLRGDFTELEFQNLCHNRGPENQQAFFDGCAAYQTQLFGISERELLGKHKLSQDTAQTYGGESQEVYIIELQGQGDVEIKIVGKETFEWLSSTPQFPRDSNSYYDETAPQEQVDALHDEDPEQETSVYITTGSWENDRALAARTILRYAGASYDSMADAIEEIRKKGDRLVDTFSGCIY